jgi:hypothetical protein
MEHRVVDKLQRQIAKGWNQKNCLRLERMGFFAISAPRHAWSALNPARRGTTVKDENRQKLLLFSFLSLFIEFFSPRSFHDLSMTSLCGSPAPRGIEVDPHFVSGPRYTHKPRAMRLVRARSFVRADRKGG